MDLDINLILLTASVWALPILLAVTLHEAAHGWVASKLGDDTALRAGRVTFNPLKHIHVFGTLVLPALLLLMSGGKFMFGFAKPVPVNFHALRHPRRDMVLVAFAGPGANFLIATASALLLHLGAYAPMAYQEWITLNLFNSMWINIVFAVFNLMPLPPLDGGRIAVGLLPRPFSGWLAEVEKFGFLILIFVLFVVPWLGAQLNMNADVIWWIVMGPSQFIFEAIAFITGLK